MHVYARVTIVTRENGERVAHAPGAELALPVEEANRLIGLGFAEPRDLAAPSRPAPAKPEGEALSAAIRDVLDALDPVEDFVTGGKPSTRSLAAHLGYPVSAAERDAALEGLDTSGEGGDAGEGESGESGADLLG
ncbi:hypothetical protein OCH7691_04471 [Oceanibacterium hippocampi]|uniref:Mu-like prophage FluMu N-terminal domain-containing protein n=2 Tax=Oceanibacterium hippocampi TaxID=745714 RepID=A0A1Y5U0W5_9PROT|nr:hypothetical protein OCH7691_04471 [Oceanibacterium hippocampi]